MVAVAENISAIEMLADDLAEFYDDPFGYVEWVFPWGEAGTPLENYKGPREWQKEDLKQWGEEIKKRGFNGVDPVEPIQMATVSGHGIGKSALTAWKIKFIMDSRPFSKGCVTANTSDQLKTKTWAELGKWHKLSLTKDFFTYNNSKGNMSFYNNNHSESWRCDALTCKEENSEAFAGLHAVTSTPFYIFDEASAVPEKIFEVAQGGLTDGEPMFFLYGNGTRNTGFFKECFGKQRHRWIGKHIDSRDVEGTNKELMQRWIDDYGIDSDFVKVRVRGMFPNTSITQFIGENIVSDAVKNYIRPEDYNFAPVIIGVDVANYGDDKSTIWLRQGLHSEKLWEGRQVDGPNIAGYVAEFEDEKLADAVFVDSGAGWSVIDHLRRLNRNPIPVYFGGTLSSTNPYGNPRAKMWGDMRDWLEAGASLPENCKDIEDDLTAPEYHYNLKGQIMLEKKEDMKQRRLHSPDDGDALAMTFYRKVIKKDRNKQEVKKTNQYEANKHGIKKRYNFSQSLRRV